MIVFRGPRQGAVYLRESSPQGAKHARTGVDAEIPPPAGGRDFSINQLARSGHEANFFERFHIAVGPHLFFCRLTANLIYTRESTGSR
ncbi:MAG: hypothetical protein ACRYHA_04255 [Janthinobacterium lividum]